MIFLFLNCRFSYKCAFEVNVTAQALSGNAIVIYLLARLLSWDLSCHFLAQEPFYCTSNQVEDTFQTSLFFLILMRTAQVVSTTNALHAVMGYIFVNVRYCLRYEQCSYLLCGL